MTHRPEEIGHEDFELGSAHKTDGLEAPGELQGGRGCWPAPQMPGYPGNGCDGPYQKEPGTQFFETLGQPDVAARHEHQQHEGRKDSTVEDRIRQPSARPSHALSLAP